MDKDQVSNNADDHRSHREIAADAFRAERPSGLAETYKFDDIFQPTVEQQDMSRASLNINTKTDE